MDPLTIIAAVNGAVTLIKSLISAGKDVSDLVQGTINVTKIGATQADVDALIALSDKWSAEIQQPIPPEEN